MPSARSVPSMESAGLRSPSVVYIRLAPYGYCCRACSLKPSAMLMPPAREQMVRKSIRQITLMERMAVFTRELTCRSTKQLRPRK